MLLEDGVLQGSEESFKIEPQQLQSLMTMDTQITPGSASDEKMEELNNREEDKDNRDANVDYSDRTETEQEISEVQSPNKVC